MKINELKANMKNVEVEAEVLEVGPSKEFSRMGKPGKVGQATIKDETGEISLTLWNEQCDEVKVGDKIRVSGAKTTEWQGKLQLSTTFNGEISKI